MKINPKVTAIVFGVLLLISYFVQVNTVFAYLEVVGYWPPTLFFAGILILATSVFFILSIAMMYQAEAKKKMRTVFLWIVCDALVWPWWIKTLNVLFDAIL